MSYLPAPNWGMRKPFPKEHRLSLAYRRNRFPRTCEWIEEEPAWREWLGKGARSPILYIYGSAGCGKTVLCNYIADRLEVIKNRALVVRLFCDVFSSMSCALDVLHNGVLGCLDLDDDGQTFFSMQAMAAASPLGRECVVWDHILTLINEKAEVIIVVDGLGDLAFTAQEFDLPAKLVEMTLRNFGKIRLLVSGRSINRQDIFGGYPSIGMTQDKVADDLVQFVDYELRGRRKLEFYVQDLSSRILQASNGNFLMAQLCIDDLAARSTYGQPPSMVCPATSLDDAYWRNIESRAKKLTTIDDFKFRNVALTLLLHAARPLTFAEMTEMLVLETNQIFYSGAAIRKVRKLCGLLVSFDGNITLISHHSVKSVLQRIGLVSGAAAHKSMARLCIKYLSYLELDMPIEKTQAMSENQFEHQYPLLRYASLYWVHHLARSGNDPELFEIVGDFMTSQNGFVWADIFLPLYLQNSIVPLPPRATRTAQFSHLADLKSQIVKHFETSERVTIEYGMMRYLKDSFVQALLYERTRSPRHAHQLLGRILDQAAFFTWLLTEGFNPLPFWKEARRRAHEVADLQNFIEATQALEEYYKREGLEELAYEMREEVIRHTALANSNGGRLAFPRLS